MTWLPLIPNLSLVLLLFAGLFLMRSAILGAAVGLFALYSASGLAVILGLLTDVSFSHSVLLSASAGLLIAAIVYSARSKAWPGRGSILATLGFALLAISIQLGARFFGLSSVAFTDGHTIMTLGQTFQGANDGLLDGTKALKRGFALPALQSFGFEGEYLVGFMPLFFATAVMLTLHLIWLLSPSKSIFVVVSTVVLAAIVSTEAILRHMFLMNTHATAWLLTAFFLIMLLRFQRNQLSSRDVTAILVAFATVAFLRLDFVFLFAPFVLTFVLLAAPISKLLSFSALFSLAIPLWSWLTFAIADFPFGGQLAPSVLAVAGLISGGFIILLQASAKKPLDPLRGNLLFALGGIMLLTTLAITNVPKSFAALFINLFRGEGLWGITILLLVGLALFSLFFRKIEANSEFAKAALRLFVASVAVYLFTKYLDGASSGSALPSFARIGFGDSLNRTLVTWLPFALLPLLRLFGFLGLGPRGSTSSSARIDKLS